MITLERWDEQHASWITLGTFASKILARTRAFELRLRIWRVREVRAVAE